MTLATWSGRDLVRDAATVLERRLIEAQRRVFIHHRRLPDSLPARAVPELPLRGFPSAPLWAIAAFLAGRTVDERISSLAAGLAWVERAQTPTGSQAEEVVRVGRTNPIPFAFAELKPLLFPAGIGPQGDEHIANPLPMLRLLSAGRRRDAISYARAKIRAAGLPAPFPAAATTEFNPQRLACSLIFPLAPLAETALLERAYPNLQDPEDADAD
jgi:CRISPR-associated protein Csx17